MKLFHVTLLLGAAIGVWGAALEHGPTDIFESEGLSKRACVSNGCECSRVRQGQYCGWCDAVTYVGKQGARVIDIFECNPQGGCCWYGKSDKCASGSWADWCPK